MAYRRLKLPHLQPVGATFSLLFLLKDAVPSPLLHKLSCKRVTTLKDIKSKKLPGWKRALIVAQISFDHQLNDLLRRHANQSHALSSPKAAKIVVDRLKEYHGKYYDLYSYSVMSNHVHAELDFSVQLPLDWQLGQFPTSYVQLDKVVNLIKGGSARYVNQLHGQTGSSLWSSRYRDRFIRGEQHLAHACAYTKNNAVTAGLVKRWEDHPFTGGMTVEEIGERQYRRVYPDVGLWLERLREFDAKS